MPKSPPASERTKESSLPSLLRQPGPEINGNALLLRHRRIRSKPSGGECGAACSPPQVVTSSLSETARLFAVATFLCCGASLARAAASSLRFFCGGGGGGGERVVRLAEVVMAVLLHDLDG